MLRSANPVLNETSFQNVLRTKTDTDSMTIQGTVNKSAILLLIVLIAASWTWNTNVPGVSTVFTMIGAIGGLVLGLVTSFKKHLSPITAPLYCVAQGLFLGGFSSTLEMAYPGIVIQAVGMTFSVLFCLLGAYKSGLIKPTENFKLGVAAATGGIMLMYFVSFIMSLFGVQLLSINNSSPFSIGISLVVCAIAALNLVMDFDFIENASEQNTPKYMEWYAAFGLMVTLIWLYIEIIRLLAKLRDRR